MNKINKNSDWAPLTKWFQNYLLLNQRGLSHGMFLTDKDKKEFPILIIFCVEKFPKFFMETRR